MLVLLAISLIAAVMFVGGATIGPALTGDDDGGGVFPVIDILRDGDDDGTALSIEANRTELTVGERVAFTVTADNDTPPRNATVAVGGARHDVDEAGRVVVRIDRSGTVAATATAPGPNGTTAESGDVSLSVAPRTVELAVRANRSVAIAGEPIALTLVRADTGGVVRGALAAAVVPSDGFFAEPETASGIRRHEGAQFVVRPERAGRLLVDGSRGDDVGATYTDASLAIPVERRPVPLSVSVDADEIVAGQSVAATVRRTDTGERVVATLAVGDRTVETGEDGTAELRFDTGGSWTIEATAAPTSAARFTPDEATVTVHRREVPLAVSVDRTAITDGGAVNVQVTRADTDEPIAATVSVDGQTLSTGPDGSVGATVDAVGASEIVATADDTASETFAPARTTIAVSNATVDLDLLDGPGPVAPGTPYAVTVRATNRGPSNGTDTLLLLDAENELLDETVVELVPGNETTVTLRATAPEAPGDWSVRVASSDASVQHRFVVES